MLRVLKRLPWIVLGAMGAWLFDGQQGADRRRRIKNRMAELSGAEIERPITSPSALRDRAA
jgi:hypothetical protein